MLTCYRYIELNPVRAENMAAHPSEYHWSSYHHNALGQPDELVTFHSEYLRLGSNSEEQQSAYRALFKTHIAEKTLAEIRELTNKAWVLGSSHFKERFEQQSKRQASPKPRGGDRKSEDYREKKTIDRV